jgi:hypothetical protein
VRERVTLETINKLIYATAGTKKLSYATAGTEKLSYATAGTKNVYTRG